MDSDNIKLFSDLECLGFKGIDNLDLYQKENDKKTASKIDAKPESFLYDRTVECPVCGKITKIKAVKSTAPRMKSRDSDFMIHYDVINPMLYEISYCRICGYAALQRDFTSISDRQRKAILSKITLNWKSKNYPEEYGVDTAIEQHKLALLNAVVKESKSSEKAILCLKISWLYRLNCDRENEAVFQKQAIQGLELAYENESLPIYGLDKYSVLYLLGELYRRIGNTSEALKYFGNIIVDVRAPAKIKEKVRDQKDLINNELKKDDLI